MTMRCPLLLPATRFLLVAVATLVFCSSCSGRKLFAHAAEVVVGHDAMVSSDGLAQLFEHCGSDRECQSGRCKQKKCAAMKRSLDDYMPCRFDSECESHHCTGADSAASQKKYLGGKKSSSPSDGILTPAGGEDVAAAEEASWRNGHCRESRSGARSARASFMRRVMPVVEPGFTRARLESHVAPVMLPEDKHVKDYYRVYAVHHRVTPVESKFTGTVNMVRVVLPWKPQQKTKKSLVDTSVLVRTKIGHVWSHDHAAFSVEEFNQLWLTKHPVQARHVELVTPARHDGGLFLAIATYVAYESAESERPIAWVFADGMASGVEAEHFVVFPETVYGTPSTRTTGRLVDTPHKIQLTPFMDPRGTCVLLLSFVVVRSLRENDSRLESEYECGTERD
jgi:hypothetical protein